MKRREILKNLALGTATTFVLPSWANAWSGSKITASNLFANDEMEMLTAIAGTFIPEGESLGAVGVEVDKYLDRLFADCYVEKDIARIKTGIASLNKAASFAYEKSFALSEQSQRESILLSFSDSEDEDKKWFYDTLRRETIRGYTTSEYVLVNHYKYVMAPGFYNGCVDVEV